MATKSFKNLDVVKAGMEVIKAKNSGTTLNALQSVTSVDFNQVTVPVNTVVAFPDIAEVDAYLYADKSVLNGTEYTTYGLLCPVVDASDNVIGTKRISLNSFQREMPVYEMQDGVPVATARTYATVMEMFKDINLPCPLVLMNGVTIYDPKKKEIIKSNSITTELGKRIVNEFYKRNVDPMLYFQQGETLEVYYKDKNMQKGLKDYAN